MHFYVISIFFMMVSVFMSFMLFLTFMEEKMFIFEWSLIQFDMFYEYKMYFMLDYVGSVFILVISLISMTAFYYSECYMMKDKMKNKFLFFTFLFVLSMYAVILSMNFFILLVAWDMLGISSYFLVIHYNSDSSNYSGIVTLLTNRMGDVGMIFSMFLLCNLMSMDILILFYYKKMLLVKIFFYMSCLAAFTKSAQFPFSSWLPLAMAAPTPISALVHSSTLVTAGVYLFIRLNIFFDSNTLFIKYLIISSGITMLLSSMGALSELDIKKIIAYSTLSQLSLMMMIVIMGYSMLSFFHILTHALFKALLFFCSGVMIHSNYEIQDIRIYNYSLKMNMLILSMFFICSISLAGFPFLSGFYSKDMILELMYSYNYNLFYIFMLMLNTIFTSLYSIRVIYYGFLMGKKNSKINFLQNWDKINNSLFFIFWGVLMFGSVLYWIMMEKLELMFLAADVKIINLIFLLASIILCLNLTFLKKYASNNFMLSMMYLYNSQNMVFSNFFIKINFLSFQSEFMLNHFLSNKIYYLTGFFSKLFFLNKFMSFYISLIYLTILAIFLK